ncbi:MAG TPA: hypothetical protein PLP09_03630 [Petrotogaceae bacterium]|nr:hypothetical protein [Petrotogaceae bacterium]
MPDEYESVIEVGTNSYIDIDDADAYFATRYGASAWAALSDETKDQLLITATQRIDTLRLKGRKYIYTQTLNFPRYIHVDRELQQSYIGSSGINDGTIPVQVEKATCEEALALLNTEATKRRELQEQGVTSFTIGKLSETFSGKVSSSSLLSSEAKNLLKSWVATKVRIR